MRSQRPRSLLRAAFAPALLAFLLVLRSAAPGFGAKPLGPGQNGTPLAPIGARSAYGAVSSDSEPASRAAASILEAGGNAVDAAVAGAFALGAAAPGNSGLGGQTWMIVHSAAGEDVAFLSPLRAPLRVNLSRARAARLGQSLVGPLAMTAPASVATLARAHARFGRLPWADLLAPAIEIAESGLIVSEIGRLFLEKYPEQIEASPELGPIYLTGACSPEGLAILFPPSRRVVYPGLARTLRRLAEAGPDDFYHGGLAAEMAADLARHDAFVRSGDLARVPSTILETRPLRGTYRGVEVLSLPAPGAGGVVVRALHILQAFPSDLLAGEAWARAQLLAESVRIAFADERGVGPGEEVADGPGRSPWLEPAWGEREARKIRLGRALGKESLPGRGARFAFTDRDTTQLSVVDRDGNAVSLTQSLGRAWGSTWVTPGLGFTYNAFLEAFDFEDQNAVTFLRPNATARTSVAPTILLREGRPVLVLGAAGSSRIPSAIANAVVAFVDGRLGVADAVAAPRSTWSEERNDQGVRVEQAYPILPEDVDLLRAAGYEDLEAYAPGLEAANFGTLNAVGWDASAAAWEAGADPRRHASVAVPARAPDALPASPRLVDGRRMRGK